MGIARDGKYWSLGDAARPFLYMPFKRVDALNLYLLMRTAPPPEAMIARVREAIQKVDPELPGSIVRTANDQIQRWLEPAREGARLLVDSGDAGVGAGAHGCLRTVGAISGAANAGDRHSRGAGRFAAQCDRLGIPPERADVGRRSGAGSRRGGRYDARICKSDFGSGSYGRSYACGCGGGNDPHGNNGDTGPSLSGGPHTTGASVAR